MKTKSFTILFAVTILVIALWCGSANAARPVPPSNETSNLYVEIYANSTGRLISDTDLTFTQGNGNLIDNPPLASDGEGQATIGYYEKTVATSGSISYSKTVELDTSSADTGQPNLETTRSIDYSNKGDGDGGVGRMYSKETVVVTEDATAATGESSCCVWGTSSDDILPATSVQVIAGSEVDLKEGQVNSDSTASTVSNDIDTGVSLTYDVSVEGSGQTGNDKAVGKATISVEAMIMEGSGNQTNQTTDMSYDESVTVDGLIDIAMGIAYSSPA